MSWFLTAVKKYAVFQGRARRREYWYFVLFYVIFALVLGVVDGLAGTVHMENDIGLFGTVRMETDSLFGIIFGVALFLPSLAVSIRRLHDTGRSGWWLLINFIPLIGLIVFLVFAAQDSEPGDNRYGANPKALEGA